MVQKKFLLAAAAVLATIAIVSLAVLMASGQRPLVVEGVLIDAGEMDPYNAFSDISSEPKFIISPQMTESMQAVDHATFNAAALFLQVLEGNGRKTVQLVRVYNGERQLLYCLTNFGDLNRSEMLEAGPCQDLLKGEDGFPILIQFPDQSLSMPSIELSEDSLVIRPSSQEDIGETSFLALRIMFRNAREVIEKSGLIFDQITA